MISIPSSLQTLYNQGVDALLASDMTSEVCQIVYPPKKVQCVNCLPGPLGQGANVYRSGGPAPFNFGSCPVCQGKGYKEEETKADVRLRVYFASDRSKTENYKVLANLKVDDYEAQLIGYMTDLVKIKRADHIMLVKNNGGNQSIKCRLIGEPVPWGFDKNRYFSVYVGKYQ
jgi:hypothetical protein